jgi:hypothetical protein
MIDLRALVLSAAALFTVVSSAPATQQEAALRLADGELGPLAEALAAHRAARARGGDVAEAKVLVQTRCTELARAHDSGDFLARSADLARAVWLSWDYDEARRERGTIVEGEHREGAFAAEGLAYAYRLPKEYDAERAWPLILTIPEEGETPAGHLRARWLNRDLLGSVILFAPAMPAVQAEWDKVTVEGRPGGLAHLLTAHRIAGERLAVDPDRVFVVGRGKGVPVGLAAGNYSPQRFAGIVGWAGDAGDLGPENFLNLPTLFAGGGAKAHAFHAKAVELGFDNCTVEADATEEKIWQWIQAHARNPWPSKVRIVVGDPFPTRVHWLRVAPTAVDTHATALADREAGRIEITCAGTSSVALFLSDALVDLDRPVTVVCNGESTEVKLERSLPETLGLLTEGISDAGIAYVAQHVIELNQPEWLDAVATEALELGGDLDPSAEEKRRLAAGWARQDLEWVPPEEVARIEEGLFKVDGEWLDLSSANRRHGALHSMWRIPSRRLVVHSTASRAVALRAMSEMQRALGDLERVFGTAPEYPIPVAVIRDEEQYDRLAFGDPDGRRPPTHVARMHVIHRAYFAESWFEPVDGDHEFRGMGVCYWDTFAPYGDRYGVHAARMAVGLSFVDALDPSPKALRKARKSGPSLEHYADFQTEKTLPDWLRYGGAVYAERYYEDTTVGADGNPWWTRDWSLENLVAKGGLRPLEEIFAFPADPDDRDDSLRLYIECGLLVAFMVDGDCAPVTELHEKLKRTLERGRVHSRTIRELEETLVEHEAELRAFAGL